MSRRGGRQTSLLALVASALLCRGAAAEPPAADQPATEGESAAPSAAPARLTGRVLDRDTGKPLASVRIEGPGGAVAETDGGGRFTLDLPAGPTPLILFSPAHDPLDVTEPLRPGEGLTVEYTLAPRRTGPGGRARYRSLVRGEARHQGTRFSLEGEALRNVPGTLGDPFRILSLLPGVATPVPLLPVYSIRGGAPGGNGFYLDGLRVPQLFHLLVGGGVVSPHLVERLDFFAGAYGASFGRVTGGVIDAETRPARADGRVHGMLELRLYELAALVEAHLPEIGGARLIAAFHYGFPTALISLLSPGVAIDYWDYQLRLDVGGFTVEALGSNDAADVDLAAFGQNGPGMPIKTRVRFHRVQARGRTKRGALDLEGAIFGGWDQSQSWNGTGIDKLGAGWRGHLVWRSPRLRLHAGTDGEVSRFTAENFDDEGLRIPDAFDELAGGRLGVVAGAFVEGTLLLPHDLSITAGARADVYHAGPVTVVGIDPRASLRWQLLPQLAIQIGGGVYQQAPSFPIALPGLDTFALGLGLQRAIQGAGTVEAKLPLGITAQVSGYYQRLRNVNDIDVEFSQILCSSPPPEALSGVAARILRQVSGAAMGLEVLLRRQSDDGRFSGWIAYTLSQSDRAYSCGLRPSDVDQRHLLNVVLQVRLPLGLLAGARLYVATGRPYTRLDLAELFDTPRNNDRLPPYVQLDLRLDREWTFSAFALSLFLEVQNATFSETYLAVTYPVVDKLRRYDQPQPIAFRWILPALGLRGRF